MSLQTAFYIIAAIITAALVAFLPGGWGYFLLVAWFAWCGGVLFDRVVLKARPNGRIVHEYKEPPLYK